MRSEIAYANSKGIEVGGYDLIVWTRNNVPEYFHDVPYILAYKPTIFGSILTFKLWGSAYTRVMPHGQSRQSARWLSVSAMVSAAHCV